MLYAKWLPRVAGNIVDSLVPAPFFLPSWFLEERREYLVASLVLLFLGLAVNAYNRWFLAGRTGQSWGRRVVGIRLVSARTGRPIGAGRAFLRDLAHILDNIILYVGYLFPLWTAKRQTIADMVTRTVVVR